MRTLIQKWGKMLAVQIPADVADKAALHEGDEVEVQADQKRITIQPVQAAAYRLDDLLAGVEETNLHAAVETGNAQGREAWYCRGSTSRNAAT